jgi:LPXTG-motif cell wall-anchored protein
VNTIWLKVVAMSSLLTLAVAGVAWAHVTVAPEEVAAGEYETLTVSVPTEKEIPTTEIRVEVPEGFTVFGVQPVPGWEHSFEEDGGVITTVTWSGGDIGPQEFQQFLLSAQAPEEPGEYPWKAIQTYEDGSVVEWTGPPDAEEPASVVEVASAGGTGGHGHDGGESDHETASASTLPDSGGTSPALYGLIGAVALLVGLATTALLRRRM